MSTQPIATLDDLDRAFEMMRSAVVDDVTTAIIKADEFSQASLMRAVHTGDLCSAGLWVRTMMVKRFVEGSR